MFKLQHEWEQYSLSSYRNVHSNLFFSLNDNGTIYSAGLSAAWIFMPGIQSLFIPELL